LQAPYDGGGKSSKGGGGYPSRDSVSDDVPF